MLSYPSRRSLRFVPAAKIIANPRFYHQWAYRSARRLSTLEIPADQCHNTYSLFEQLAQIRGFAYAVMITGVQQ